MMWQVASGILIAASVLAIIAVGIMVGINRERDETAAPALVITLIGIGIAVWIVIAHWPVPQY